MKTKELIRYRVAVSVKFPVTHPRKGEDTYFAQKIMRNIDCKKCPHELCDNCGLGDVWNKLHTIRGNYKLWAKRFEKINKGEAVLELYQWSGKPYKSKCVTICQLNKEDGIGLQALELSDTMITGLLKDNDVALTSKNGGLSLSIVAKNDGLSLKDFKAWFKGADLTKPMAIIHFTSFRY